MRHARFPAILLFALLAGCESLPATQATVTRLQDDVTNLKAQASTMPADSPDRKLILENADKAQKTLDTANAVLSALQGDASGLTQATRDIPYAGLGIAVLTIIMREIKLRKVNAALTQTVTGLETAKEGMDPAAVDKIHAALSESQDVASKALIAPIKATA